MIAMPLASGPSSVTVLEGRQTLTDDDAIAPARNKRHVDVTTRRALY